MNDLWREFVQTLGQLELLSHGSTASWQGFTTRGERSFGRPPGESNPPHLFFRERWSQASTDWDRTVILEDAKTYLKVHRGHSDARQALKPEDPKLRDKDLVKRGEGWDVREVAAYFRLRPSEVMEIRKAHGRDPSTGRVLRVLSDDERRLEARRLLERGGLGLREIARRTGLHQEQVRRLAA